MTSPVHGARSLGRSAFRAVAARPFLARRASTLMTRGDMLLDRQRWAVRPRTVYRMIVPRPYAEDADIDWRPLDPERDLVRVAEIAGTVFGWHPDRADYSVAGLARRAARPGFDPSLVLVHERDGRIAAFAWGALGRGPVPIPVLEDLAVDPPHHGSGIGRRLMAAAVNVLEARTTEPVHLYVDAGNVRAARLYLGLGCVIVRVEHDWRHHDAWVTEPLRP